MFPGSGRGNSLPTVPTGATAKSEVLTMYFHPTGDFQDSGENEDGEAPLPWSREPFPVGGA